MDKSPEDHKLRTTISRGNASEAEQEKSVSLQPPTLQLKADQGGMDKESTLTKSSNKPFQFAGGTSSPNQNNSAKENNTGLPSNLKSGVESLSGFSLDDVNVHYNSSKPAQLKAHAYAQGTDIHVSPGQEQHLSHEAWHVVQQKQGRVQPTVQMHGSVNINDNQSLESEADVMGAKALQMKSYSDAGNDFVSPANTPVFQLAGDEGEEGNQESWGSWLWKHKFKLAAGAGLTLGAAYVLYNNSGGQAPAIPAPTEAVGAVADVASAGASAASAGADASESIFAMSLRQTLNGVRPGDAAPPCPLDAVTGGPDLDAWGELIEKAVKPLFERALD